MAARGANDGLWDWDLKSGVVAYSERWIEFVGPANAGVGIRDWLDRIHPDDRPQVTSALEAHLAGDTLIMASEHRLCCNGGQWRWVFSRAIAERDEHGAAIRLAGSLTDMTARHLHDPLTGLMVRDLFEHLLALSFQRGQRGHGLMSVLAIGLQGLDTLQRRPGYDAVDAQITQVSQRVRSCLRPGDAAARIGPDTFVLLLDGLHDVDDATSIADRLLVELGNPVHVDLAGHATELRASIGISMPGGDGQTESRDLIEGATRAMERARSRGGGCWELFLDGMHANAAAEWQRKVALRKVLDRRELRLAYQPIIGLKSGRILGFEALLRWTHPELGQVSPAEFVPLAEKTGMIIPIGLWVLEQACAQVAKWQEYALPGASLTVNVNVSGVQFAQPDLAEQVRKVIHDASIDPLLLKLEITESAVIENGDVALRTLQAIREQGITINMDDFGTGYSSLSALHKFPIDILKVDRSFIRHLDEDPEAYEVVRTIISLARTLHLKTTAEGIETAEHLSLLRKLGCDYGQGYLFAAPLDPDRARELLESNPVW